MNYAVRRIYLTKLGTNPRDPGFPTRELDYCIICINLLLGKNVCGIRRI